MSYKLDTLRLQFCMCLHSWMSWLNYVLSDQGEIKLKCACLGNTSSEWQKMPICNNHVSKASCSVLRVGHYCFRLELKTVNFFWCEINRLIFFNLQNVLLQYWPNCDSQGQLVGGAQLVLPGQCLGFSISFDVGKASCSVPALRKMR